MSILLLFSKLMNQTDETECYSAGKIKSLSPVLLQRIKKKKSFGRYLNSVCLCLVIGFNPP